GHDGMEIVGQILEMLDHYTYPAEVLVASVRSPIHVIRAAQMGAHVATCPFAVLQQLVKHPLTDVGLERFRADWEKTQREASEPVVPSDDEDFAALLAASEREQRGQRRVAVGDVVRGRVIAVGATTAFVAVGGKAEAAIDVNEFRDPGSGELRLAVGDEIEATVVDDGTRSGSIVLKRVAGRGGHVPGELEQAFANGIPVEGLVVAENKGGFELQLGSARAFCPASQIDRRRGEA